MPNGHLTKKKLARADTWKASLLNQFSRSITESRASQESVSAIFHCQKLMKETENRSADTIVCQSNCKRVHPTVIGPMKMQGEIRILKKKRKCM